MIEIRNYIESNPKVMLGKPLIKGTRITIELLLVKFAYGFELNYLLEAYSNLKKEDAFAAIAYAAMMIRNEEIIITQ